MDETAETLSDYLKGSMRGSQNGKCREDFLMMRPLKLIECIANGSELGELPTLKGIGRHSVDRLIEGGFRTIDALASVSVSGLIDMGIRVKQAGLIIKRVQKQYR